MSIADSLFHRDDGDDLHRGPSGLAYSDREIALMKAWIEECEGKVRELIEALADSMKSASQALQPVHGSIEEAMQTYRKQIDEFQTFLLRITRLNSFQVRPIFERHDIPAGGMPDGISPKDFDQHRNKESVFDDKLERALEAQKKKKLEEKRRRELELQAEEQERESEEEKLANQRMVEEFLGELPPTERRVFEAKLKDQEFNEAFVAAVNSTGALVAAVAINDQRRVDEYRKILTTQLAASPDLIAVARVYLGQAEAPISIMQAEPGFGIPASRIPQAVAACEKLLLDLEDSVEKKTKKGSQASATKSSKAKAPAKATKPAKSTSNRG